MKQFLQKLPKRIIFDILFLLLLSLTPFLWLKQGEIIAGHDSGLPLSPYVHWQDRLNTWTNRYDGGKDQSFALAGFFIHGYEALLDTTSLTLTQQQIIQFSTYFFLIGLSMYLMFITLFEKEYHHFAIIAAVAYQINHFVLQAWFIAERTKFTMYIAVPLAVTVLHLFLSKKISLIPSAILISIIFFVLNGGGFLPLYGASLVIIGIFVTMHLIFSKRKIADIFLLLKMGLTILGISLALSSYWLFPYMQYVKGNFAGEVAQSGGISGIINWVKSISENTSYLNIMKLQGIQEWYVNPEHPYANYYFSSLALTILSNLFLLIPVLVLFLQKNESSKKKVLFLLGVYLTSIFLMSGSHQPFGFLYIWMIKYVPGFIAFRTPFYKFAPGLWLSLSPLFAILIYQISHSKFFKKIPQYIFIYATITAILVFNFPFFVINFFQYTKDRTTKISVPDYVFSYSAMSTDQKFSHKRILLLPGANPENGVYEYSWKYWSLASPMSLLDTNAYISPLLRNRYDQKVEMELYNEILENRPGWEKLSMLLGIDAILLQKDVTPFTYRGTKITPASFEKNLLESEVAKLEENFGEWQLFSLPEIESFNLSNQYIKLSDSTKTFFTPLYLHHHVNVSPNTPIITDNQDITNISSSGSIVIPECQDCDIGRRQFLVSTSNPATAPGSALYPLLEIFRSKSDIDIPKDQIAIESLNQSDQLFNSFLQKVPYISRKIIWDKYSKIISQYEQFLNSYFLNPIEKTSQNNDLQIHLNNMLAQEQKLRSISGLIDQQDEAEIYYQIMSSIQSQKVKIFEKLLTTTVLHENTYPLQIDDEDNYIFSLYLPSTNSSEDGQTIPTIFLDGQQISTKQHEDWFDSSPVSLKKGLHKIVVNDVNFFSPINIDQSERIINYAGENGCQKIPLGYLESGLYVIFLEAKSISGEVKPDFHFVSQNDQSPKLAYWGISQEISDSSWRKIKLPFQASTNDEYFFTICDESSTESLQIILNNFSIDRIIEPFIAVSSDSIFQKSEEEEKTKVDSQRISSTKYQLSIPDINNPVLLSSHIPYSKFWMIDKRLSPISINGNYSGWVLEPGSPKELTIEYSSQNLYKAGWIISGIVFGVIIIIFARHVIFKKN